MGLGEDIRSIQARDPANPTFMEVVLAYNGFHAVVIHRAAHWLWGLELRALARFLSNLNRILTGVEIHPEAKIGERLFIDHGTGVVIGQTAVVGDDVTLYQGVTLGGYGRTQDKGVKRHPTICDGAMIGAYAQVLGDIMVGKKSKIGANSVLTMDIPDGCTALGIPAQLICKDESDYAYGMPAKEEIEKISFTFESIVRKMEERKQDDKKPAAKKKSSAS